MKVALLHNVNRGQSEHETEFDLPITIEAITHALEKRHQVVPVECTADFRWAARLALEKPDIAFNVAEGFNGAAREALYPAICEQIDVPYTGPGPTELLICHNKALTKKLLEGSDVPLAWSMVIRDPKELDLLDMQTVPFPLIIKLNTEGSSLGMDEHCIVHTANALQAQIVKLHAKFHSDIIAEQYIEGTDLSTSFIEGMGIYGPVEYTYPSGSIYDFRLKSSDNHQVGVGKPHDLDETDQENILKLTEQVVRKLDINGYGRADFRYNPTTHDLVFLEMNAQVCFHPDGAFVLGATEYSDISYEDVVLHIVEHAMKNRRRISRAGLL